MALWASRARPVFLSRSGRQALLQVLWHVAMLTFGTTMLVPLVWLVSTSFKEKGHEFIFPPQWIPDPVKWENYPTALTILPFNLYVRNTLIVVALALIGALLTSSLAAFAFARLRFPLRDFWFMVVISTLMLPGIVTLIPRFILFRHLGWVDTLLPLIVPAWLGGGPLNIFLIRQFFRTIPYELDEAARVDGANSLRIWWQILMPLSGPVLATVAVLSFLFHWNDFLEPLIYLNSEENKTIAIGLNTFRSLQSSDWNLMMAASAVMIVPVLVIFFAAQKYFVQSINVSGFGGR